MAVLSNVDGRLSSIEANLRRGAVWTSVGSPNQLAPQTTVLPKLPESLRTRLLTGAKMKIYRNPCHPVVSAEVIVFLQDHLPAGPDNNVPATLKGYSIPAVGFKEVSCYR